jgi:hypothetical protein
MHNHLSVRVQLEQNPETTSAHQHQEFSTDIQQRMLAVLAEG